LPDCLQRLADLAGADGPLARVLLQQAQDQRLQRVRAVGAVPGRGDGRGVEVLADDRHRLVANERRAAADHLVEHGAERVEVGAIAHFAAHGLLGRHVVDRPDHHAGLGEAGAVDGHGEAEVAHLDGAGNQEPGTRNRGMTGWFFVSGSRFLGQPHVAWFDIPVDDALRVRQGEPLADLLRDLDRLLDGELVLRRLFDQPLDIAAGQDGKD
jgi:hypothetical protein